MLNQLYKDRENKIFKLYINIEDLKVQMKKGFYTHKVANQIYKDTIDYICDNLNSELEIQTYLNNNFFNKLYTIDELSDLPSEQSNEIIQKNSAILELYHKQYEFHRENYTVKLKCVKCGHIQDTYPISDEKTNPCEKCNSTVFTDLYTTFDNDNNIVCCGIKSKISQFTDSFNNCYATHVYNCSKCDKNSTIYLFREREE